MNAGHDPLDELLGKPQFGENADGVRDTAQAETARADIALAQAVLAKTVPVLKRRRVVRRLAWSMALAGCYLAGIASFGVWTGQHRPTAPLVASDANDARQNVGRQNDARQNPPTASQTPPRSRTRFEQLREEGAVALRAQNVETAIRLYAQALEAATPQERTVSVAHDDWLLMSLKQAHTKESRDVVDQDKS